MVRLGLAIRGLSPPASIGYHGPSLSPVKTADIFRNCCEASARIAIGLLPSSARGGAKTAGGSDQLVVTGRVARTPKMCSSATPALARICSSRIAKPAAARPERGAAPPRLGLHDQL